MVITIGIKNRPGLPGNKMRFCHLMSRLIRNGKDLLLVNVVLRIPMRVLSTLLVKGISSLRLKGWCRNIRLEKLSSSMRIAIKNCPRSKTAINRKFPKLQQKRQSKTIDRLSSVIRKALPQLDQIVFQNSRLQSQNLKRTFKARQTQGLKWSS